MGRWLSSLMLIAALSGCGGSASSHLQFQSTDITGVNYGKDFHLTDFRGKQVGLADFKGKVVVVFFGYTHCPDVCPTTLSDLSMVLKQMGGDANQVQVIFITVDPARDTPKVLSEYVPAFNPTFLGLYGTEAQTAATAKEFRVFYQKHYTSPSKTDYTMDHSAGSYVFDKSGRLRLYLNYGEDPKAIAHDLELLVKSS